MYRRGWGIVGIVLSTVPFYSCVTYNESYIDENFAIARNQDVIESRWADIWVHDFWGWTLTPDEDHWTSKSYRPLVTLSFALQKYVGSTLGMMRLANCALHTLNSVLVYVQLDSIWAALAFSLHPVHMENIVYLVGRADCLATSFFLVATLWLPDARKQRSGEVLYFAAVAICTVAAGLSKETGFTLPILIAFRVLWRDEYRRAAWYIACFLVVFVLRSWFVGGSDVGFSYIDTPVRYQDSVFDRTLSYLMLHATYLQLVILPFHQSWDYSFDALPIVRTLADVRLLAVVAAYLCVACLASMGARRLTLLWGAAWLVVPFVPASNLFFLVGTTVGERLLYPSTVGWSIVLSRVPRRVVALFVVWYAYRSAVRLSDWRTPADLFMADSVYWDRSAKVLHQRGVLERSRGNRLLALNLFNRSLQVFDDNALTDFMIAQIHLDVGQCAEALERFHKINDGHGIGFGDHNHALLVTEFAFANVCTQSFAHAVALFETEMPYTRSVPYLLNAYALALDTTGRKQDALNAMQDAVEINPAHAHSWTNLGTLCAVNDLRDCFVVSYHRAAELSPEEQASELLLSVKEEKPQDWVFFRD